MFLVLPPPKEIISGFIPRIPNMPGAKLMVAAFVGTTMAGQLYIIRPTIVKMKGWSSENLREHSRDAFIGPLLTFIISGSIMVAATGVLFSQGKVVTHVLDMVYTLEPVAGKYAMSVFMLGTFCAGITPVFSILIFTSLLISDYRTGVLDIQSGFFRIVSGITCLCGLIVPVIGFNPITAQIASQVSMVFVLPLAIAAIYFLVNSKKNMGEHTAGPLLNFGMITAFIFSCFISYNAVLAIIELIGF
jgi:Mn2+/Fe2+ NRAMP family transporter